MHVVAAQEIALRPGRGEALFGGRIVLKSALPELTVTESWFATARPGADPHLHRRHTDAFYVLEGELGFLVGRDEHVVGAGGFVCAPPGVVHGFRSLSPARFLNVHTPDGGFADNLRARSRGEPGGFDSVPAEPGSGLPASRAILLRAGEGARAAAGCRDATVKVDRDEITVLELVLEPGPAVLAPAGHAARTDAYYVLAGEAAFGLGSGSFRALPGSFVAAPPGTRHTVAGGPTGVRLLHLRAPHAGPPLATA